MTNNLFDYAEACLFDGNVERKLQATAGAWSLCLGGALDFEPLRPAAAIADTRFPERPIQVDPRDLPRRNMDGEGKAAFLHAIAHIEFTAIHLAWDILYRFRDMPREFCRDWLSVAQEEALHFSMVRARLRNLGADYGDLPVHRGLWDVAGDTADDLLVRLALVPRYMEARGLDVTPAMIARLERVGDRATVRILTRIMGDEVGHVAAGSRWFRWVCAARGLEPDKTYFDLLEGRLRGRVRGPFNHTLRRAAGFSTAELERLERMGHESY